jgi:MATE family multidrug resistance protein
MPANAARPVHTVRSEMSALWWLSWPMLVGQLATVGMGVADVAMTGHVSAAELAAVSLGASVWSIILVTVMGIMMAINPVVAHDVGAGRSAGFRIRCARRCGWALVSACWPAWPPTCARSCSTISAEAQVRANASLFLHAISLGMPAFACYRALYGYTTSINQTKPIMVIAILGLLFNVFVNWLLIFGTGACPSWAVSAARWPPRLACG